MTPIPRTPEEQRALVDEIVGVWKHSGDLERDYSKHPSSVSMRKCRLRKRAKELVKHCLDRSVIS